MNGENWERHRRMVMKRESETRREKKKGIEKEFKEMEEEEEGRNMQSAIYGAAEVRGQKDS